MVILILIMNITIYLYVWRRHAIMATWKVLVREGKGPEKILSDDAQYWKSAHGGDDNILDNMERDKLNLNIKAIHFTAKLKWIFKWWMMNSSRKVCPKHSKMFLGSGIGQNISCGIVISRQSIFCKFSAKSLRENARKGKYWVEMAFGKVSLNW